MVLDRLRAAVRRVRPVPAFTLERQPDALPKTGLFAEPVRVFSLRVLDPEPLADGRRRVQFLVEVRDAEDRRCSDLAVEARVRGPERERVVSGTTDLLGRIRFRMAGPAGEYAIAVTDVAAGGLAFDAARDTTTRAVVD
ncbi:hypothetical protein [Egicoccus halophilus]|uniref:Uncharacterized protein n=1 Tax=Egicoccus halophilus TaxID=1670830 RepID=A0A8J3ET47_9ACTN|nr:hypothetical protein [Egicoccus halophilus]GGI04449.1 hypothetical protein GCM10011354_09150 [Egicoccus halophilus]